MSALQPHKPPTNWWRSSAFLVLFALLLMTLLADHLLWIFLAVMASVFGTAALVLMVKVYRLGQLPISALGAKPQGLAAFKGKLAVTQAHQAPLSGQDCQYWELTVVREELKRLGKRRERSTVSVGKVSSSSPFVQFVDGTGSCWLPAHVGQWDLHHRTIDKDRADMGTLAPLFDPELKTELCTPGDWVATESYVKAGEELYVIGCLTSVPQACDPTQAQWQSPTLMDMLSKLFSEPSGLFKPYRCNASLVSDQAGMLALMPETAPSLLATPIIGNKPPQALAASYRVGVLVLAGVAALFALAAVVMFFSG